LVILLKVLQRSAFPYWVFKGLIAAVLIATLGACSDMQINIPGVEKPLYRDEFVIGQTGSWKLESDENGSTTIVPEQLLIEINNPDLVQYATLKDIQLSDFMLEVDGRILSGSPQSSYGVLFRMQGPEQFYRFEITGDGTYLLERHDQGGGRTLFMGDWRSSASINEGLNVTNHIGIEARGPNISLYVNDELLDEVTDDAYLAGNIALDAGTFASAPLQVAFDNLTIYAVD
jgi:3-keto-disaccharide hydrolase